MALDDTAGESAAILMTSLKKLLVYDDSRSKLHRI